MWRIMMYGSHICFSNGLGLDCSVCIESELAYCLWSPGWGPDQGASLIFVTICQSMQLTPTKSRKLFQLNIIRPELNCVPLSRSLTSCLPSMHTNVSHAGRSPIWIHTLSISCQVGYRACAKFKVLNQLVWCTLSCMHRCPAYFPLYFETI